MDQKIYCLRRKIGVFCSKIFLEECRWLTTLLLLLGFFFFSIGYITTRPNTPQSIPFNGGDGIIGRPGHLRDKALLRRPREVEGEECSSTETVTSQGGTIESPGYPHRYPSNLDCQWLLVAHDKERNIVLRVRSLDLENDQDCLLDYLQVHAGSTTQSPPIAHLCGTINDNVIVTNSTTVLLTFHSDISYEESGFVIDYYLQSVGDCRSKLTDKTGSVNSPKFPDNYPDDTECWTLISVPEDKQIILQFKTLDLEYDNNCTYDFVEIFDGPTTKSKSFGRFCTMGKKAQIRSTTNSLLIHFQSDHLVNNKGFLADYTTLASIISADINKLGGCLWESEQWNGTIASPNYPHNYPGLTECNILLSAPQEYVITLILENVAIEPHENCSYDYVDIRDGLSEDSESMGKVCGMLHEEMKFTSTQNHVLVTFRSDDFTEFSGFKARYWFHGPKYGIDDDFGTDTTGDSIGGEPPPREENRHDIFAEKPQNATLTLGEAYMLHCSAVDPFATIRWLKDDHFLGGNTPMLGLKLVANNTLWIQSMNKDLVGIYTCAAVMPEKTHYARAWIKLENHDATCNIVLRKVPHDASLTEGHYAYMECLAAGNQVEIYWEKDGERLESHGHIKVVRQGFLFMEKIEKDDAGTYACVVVDLISQCQKRVAAVITVNEEARIREVCGKPKMNRTLDTDPRNDHAKIIGGNDAVRGAHPWQVMLWTKQLKVFCGGSLINERWIVTAAHCFRSYKGLHYDDVVIKLGKVHSERREAGEVVTHIAENSAVIIHPLYDKHTFDNDIALVRLKNHVKFTDYIMPICLGDSEIYEQLMNHKPLLAMGTVTGWGKLKEKGRTPVYLQEISMPIVNQKICINSTTYKVTHNMFCAGYAQEMLGDSCHGDSGGPFAMYNNNRWYLVGIVSWGEGCGKANKYGFYAKISNYLPWITGIMKS